MRAPIAALSLLAGLTACQEPPSFRLRWNIEGRGVPTTIACAESGLLQVRARAYQEPNLFVDELVLPCAPDALEDPEGLVDGHHLEPGLYALQLRGIDRTGATWNDESLAPLDPSEVHNGCNAVNDYTECRPTELVCGCLELEVSEGDIVELRDFVLVPPPECIDGIDNDRDGFVDARDPACSVDGGVGGEGIPVGLTELRLRLSFLADNPVATCSSVGVRDIQVRVEGEGGTQAVLDATCDTERPYLLTLRLPAGTYEFSVVALDRPAQCDEVDDACARDGLSAAACVDRNPACFADTCADDLGGCADAGMAEEDCEALFPQCTQSGLLTVPAFFSAEIAATGGSVSEEIDFAAEDFLVPIEGRISVSPLFSGSVGVENKDGEGEQNLGARGVCSAVSAPGTLELPTLRMTLLDAHGGSLEAPVLLDGIPLDGSDRPCAPIYLTDPLTWGGYLMHVQALSTEGEVCFDNLAAPAPMRPSETLGVAIPRVWLPVMEGGEVVGYEVPASCGDCEAAADCGPDDAWACIDATCQLPCTIDRDCESPELGDLGFDCVEVEGLSDRYCRRLRAP